MMTKIKEKSSKYTLVPTATTKQNNGALLCPQIINIQWYPIITKENCIRKKESRGEKN